jgi:hypothetical protein
MTRTGEAYNEEAETTPHWHFSTDTVSAEIRATAEQMIADSQVSGSQLEAALNGFLGKYLPWPYRVTSGKAFDSTGAESLEFESMIYVSPGAIGHIPADNLACAIAVHEKLGLAQLGQSYEKIAHVKSLAKSSVPTVSQDVPVADATMGIIFAVDSDAPIEAFAEELARLNREHSYRSWPDMIVVLSRGTVNLMCQMPYGKLGDFLPPAREASHRTAMYIHVFARAHAAFALNKMCAVLFPYLYFFQPGVGFPPYKEILKNMPATGMPIAAFQFDLKGDLVPVPTSMRFDELFLFPLSFRVEDRQGNLHAKVQYLPWQDGGVVRVQGQFPIEALLVFAGKSALREPIVRFQGEQTSGVIPMSRGQFKEMANRMARQSNMVIKPDKRPNLVVEQRGNEGTSSPFVARLFMGICEMRDQSIADKALRQKFDQAFEGVHAGLESLRDAAGSVAELYSAHTEAVARGVGARNVNGDIIVDKPVDRELRKQIESVVSTASRVFKDKMRELLSVLGVNIGFLYQKPNAFAHGIAKLRTTDDRLADYLLETRTKWSERFSNCRNDLEHGTWVLPHVRYEPNGTGVRVIEPLVDAQPATEFVAHIVDRIYCFVEELCAHAFQSRLQYDVAITEIPLSERKPEVASRFRLALIGGGKPIWTIAYHDTKFEDT